MTLAASAKRGRRFAPVEREEAPTSAQNISTRSAQPFRGLHGVRDRGLLRVKRCSQKQPKSLTKGAPARLERLWQVPSCRMNFAGRFLQRASALVTRRRQMLKSLKHYTCVETLPDGQRITIRATHPDDGPRIRQAFSQLDPRTRYMRFLGRKEKLSDQEINRLTEADFENAIALLATIGEAQAEVVIGGASCFVINPGAARRDAEVAFTVEQHFQHRGVGAALMRHLTQVAMSKGLHAFKAEVFCSNAPMLNVFRRSGLPMTTRQEDNVLHVTLALDETPLARSA
jgi:GNAT superfamily N-acetyltransferase